MTDFTAFDIETPNGESNKLCSIGLVHYVNGRIAGEEYYLVNPECRFDYHNVKIHGIHQEDVAGAPTFPEVWKRISHYFDGIVVAHGAADSDLIFLGKTLVSYDIPRKPLKYICTYSLSFQLCPDAEHRKLDFLCEKYGVSLEHHHNALDDARACGDLLLAMTSDADIADYAKDYDFDEIMREKLEKQRQGVAHNIAVKNNRFNHIENTITRSNGRLSTSEINGIKKWIASNSELSARYLYSDLFMYLNYISETGRISPHTRKNILYLISVLKNPLNYYAATEKEYASLNLNGRYFGITGEFEYGDRGSVIAYLEGLGCRYTDERFSDKITVLVAGKYAKPRWSCISYGTKLESAMKQKDEGHEIYIVTEQQLFGKSEVDDGNEI